MNALTRNYPDITTMLAPEATVEQVRGDSYKHACGVLRVACVLFWVDVKQKKAVVQHHCHKKIETPW